MLLRHGCVGCGFCPDPDPDPDFDLDPGLDPGLDPDLHGGVVPWGRVQIELKPCGPERLSIDTVRQLLIIEKNKTKSVREKKHR